MGVWGTLWMILMVLWLFGVGYWTWEPARPYLFGGVLIPWLCVLILGLVLFGAVPAGASTVR